MASIVDSHIHLWPKETANEAGHAWMTPGMSLAKPCMLEDYCKASQDSVIGVVYVETDVRYEVSSGRDVAIWAKGPLDEIFFLRYVTTHGLHKNLLCAAAIIMCERDSTSD